MKSTPYFSLFVIIATALSLHLLLVTAVSAQSDNTQLFVPLLISNVDDCAQTEQEQALVDLIRSAPDQGRATLACNAILQTAARAQSRDMADRGYCTTIDPDGNGPNQRVRLAGYVLPRYYNASQDANNVQTVGCGYPTAQELWNALQPNDHLIGKGDFWGKQVEYGIAHYELTGTQYAHYWVIITAEPGQ